MQGEKVQKKKPMDVRYLNSLLMLFDRRNLA